MPQNISNAGERRASMLQFGFMFIFTVILACLVCLRACNARHEVTGEQLALLKEKESIAKALGEAGDRLLIFQKGQQDNSPSVTQYENGVNKTLVEIHGRLEGKDTTYTYKEVNKILKMADNYFAQLKSVGRNADPLQRQVDILQLEKNQLELNLQNCQNEKNQLSQKVNRLEERIDNLNRREK